jgi:hypothetical protein
MKYVRLLNAIRAIAFISAAVVAFVGASRPHHGRGIRGWPAHAFVLCWGIALLATVAGIMAEGKIKMAHRDPLNPENDLVKYWILVGAFSVVGSVCSIVGVVKLISDLSTAS